MTVEVIGKRHPRLGTVGTVLDSGPSVLADRRIVKVYARGVEFYAWTNELRVVHD